jgi:DNA-binding HxlR family transcriptional regulator
VHPSSGSWEDEAVRVAIRHIAARWSVPIAVKLAQRPYRFNSLHRAIAGISHRLLTVSLQRLERDGLVARTVTASQPPAVEYRLTAVGSRFLSVLDVVANWARADNEAIQAAQRRYDEDHRKGPPPLQLLSSDYRCESIR